ncbi:asparagine synthase (glutamine-hydrolyzing) [Patescibacteria group bacterium]|nr:asparagine synthase (glutamine-hydrolyzing) [Patescibacteria group bacterium]
MCGIGGYFGEGSKDELSRINDILAHRGPDGQGVWEGKDVGLAHRRLAIIDLSPAAAQPMHRKNLSIVFNGEIYNYKELRKELESKGRTFSTQSDTEVILALFEEEGEKMFARLEGMFSIGLYDGSNDTLFLARDRFGEKPLYYIRTERTLMFASEPKALFAHTGIAHTVSSEGLASYLSYDVSAAPFSMFEHISKVPPATYLVVTRSGLREERYWHPSFTPSPVSEAVALKELDTLLEAAVGRQLVSDVPLGVFLSGGIDSSLIAAYAKKLAGEVHTFSVGFDEKSFDESSYARQVAKHIGTIHHEHILNAKDIEGALHTMAGYVDEPIADPATLPLHLLSSFAREKITVALSGDGSDELFLGYPTFFAQQLLHGYKFLPQAVRKGISSAVDHLPVSHGYMSFDFKARQFLKGADKAPPKVHHAWLAAFSEQEISQLLTPAHRDTIHSIAKRDEHIFSEASGAPPLTQSSWWYSRALLELYLTKADRASMCASLETRAPFLDRAVAEYALTLPSHLKLNRGRGKYILRRLAEQKLPHSIAWRKKHGFGLPVGQWLRGEWKELLTETLSESNVRKAGLCEPRVVSRYVEEHIEGTRNHSKKLFSLLMLHLWHHQWVQQ